MTTFVRAAEAARLLGVTTPTLYSYVSRGRVTRRLGADGRSSLFDVAEIEGLRERNRRPAPPAPSIDVRISTSITQLDERGVRYRDVAMVDLVDESFESVAEFLWTGTLDSTADAWRCPVDVGTDDRVHVDGPIMAIIRAATRLDPSAEPLDTARTLLGAIPVVLGAPVSASTNRRSFADRLTRAWVARPTPQLVDAVNAALVLLADHELATSTLGVRVATSVRSSAGAAIIAGLAAVEGDLHGSASHHVHRFFVELEDSDPDTLLRRYRTERRRVPGFGHRIYRQQDPRFELLMERVAALSDRSGRFDRVQHLLGTAGSSIAHPPNIDLALGALSYVAQLPDDMPLFAVARIAGWVAHHLEELDERPLRYRGLAR